MPDYWNSDCGFCIEILWHSSTYRRLRIYLGKYKYRSKEFWSKIHMNINKKLKRRNQTFFFFKISSFLFAEILKILVGSLFILFSWQKKRGFVGPLRMATPPTGHKDRLDSAWGDISTFLVFLAIYIFFTEYQFISLPSSKMSSNIRNSLKTTYILSHENSGKMQYSSIRSNCRFHRY